MDIAFFLFYLKYLGGLIWSINYVSSGVFIMFMCTIYYVLSALPLVVICIISYGYLHYLLLCYLLHLLCLSAHSFKVYFVFSAPHIIFNVEYTVCCICTIYYVLSILTLIAIFTIYYVLSILSLIAIFPIYYVLSILSLMAICTLYYVFQHCLLYLSGLTILSIWTIWTRFIYLEYLSYIICILFNF